jgi:hypothetical protein
MMRIFNGGRGMSDILKGWLRIAGQFSVVSLCLSHSSTSKPPIGDNHITDARNVVDGTQGG